MFRTIISLGAVAAAGALFFLYTQPTYDTIKTMQTDIGEYDQALTKAAELQRLKQQLLSRYNSFNPEDLDRLHRLLPDHVDNVRLVLDLDTLATKNGLALQNVVISAPTQATTNESEIEVIGTDQGAYDSLTITFATQGTYQRFTQFLADLESSLRIVDLVSLSLRADGGAVGADPTYRFDITVRTYWLK